MRNLILLLQIQLRALSNSLLLTRKANKGGKVKRAAGGALFAIACVGLVAMTEFYLGMFAFGIAVMGLLDALPLLAVTMGALAGTAFAFMKARGTLFGFADYDLVMSLPVSRRCVVASRLAALFASATVFALLCMAPLYVVYFLIGGVHVPALIAAVASVILAPMIPTSIAVFASFALTALATRFRHANLVYIVFALVGLTAIVVGCYTISFGLSASENTQAAISGMGSGLAQAQTAISTVYPPATWAARAVHHTDALAFLAFAGTSIAAGAVCLEILQRNYLAINGLLAGRTRRMRLDAAQLAQGSRASSPFKALVIKELRTQIGIPSYAINCLFGYVLMFVLTVALIVGDGRGQLSALALSELGEFGPHVVAAAVDQLFLLLPWIFAFCCVAAPTAAVALSLEGKHAWIVATLPVSLRTVLGAKLAANAIPLGGLLVISAAALLVSGQINALLALEIVVCSFGLFYFFSNLGMAIDARRPNFAWTSVQEVVKRSAPVLISVIAGMLLMFGLGWLTMYVLDIWGPTGSHAVILISGTLGLLLGQLLFNWTCKRVPKLEL